MSLAARSDTRLLAYFALLSLIATGCGIAAMVLSGTPQMRWIPNVIVWVLGGGAAFAIARTAPSSRVWIGIALGALALVAATLVGPDQQGVHRWLAAGPLFVNIASLTLPAAIVAMARLGAQHRLVPIIATLLAAILALQPDASQAFALALTVTMPWRVHLQTEWVHAHGATVFVRAACRVGFRAPSMQQVCNKPMTPPSPGVAASAEPASQPATPDVHGPAAPPVPRSPPPSPRRWHEQRPKPRPRRTPSQRQL